MELLIISIFTMVWFIFLVRDLCIERITHDVFYAEKDQMLFWVVGYSGCDSTSNVFGKIRALLRHTFSFAVNFRVNPFRARTLFVEDSRCYRSMRVIYVKTNTPPSIAYFIKKDNSRLAKLGYSKEQMERMEWTMWSWLTN